MEKKLSKVDFFLNIDLFISGIAFAILVLVTFVGVIMRYAMRRPFMWQEEVQLASIVWVVFLGSGAAFRTGNHVAIEIIVDALPKTLRKIIETLNYLLVVVVLIYLLNQGTNLVKQLSVTQRLTNILHIPYYLIYVAFPVGCVLMIVNYTVTFYRTWFVNGEIEQEKEKNL